ncbi:alpha-l-rhamnosidase [Colletotrichum musicola]|uniref:Alpha-l-rhamnosidase n=1 Tax=Colletotrichum musicola TaxID=2175873 RepID=A0A8H6NI77_9PEZI|nr:alpha-l-rhamnosidase [Colletotrichum musicola]
MISPKKVLSVSGGAQRASDSGPFTLANGPAAESGSQATIVFDYGRCVGGLPVIVFDSAKADESIGLRVVYSETIEGVDCETGDGPFFLFSSAMDSYRSVSIAIDPSDSQHIVRARLAQRSQRYLKLLLLSADASVVVSSVGMEEIRPPLKPKASFHCSDETLNRIWADGVRTVDMCTVLASETAPSWDVTAEGTRVPGQHWAPCRQGTRWGDMEVSFEVLVERTGASWGVHMVANGIIFCLDLDAEELRVCEGLAHQSSVFPIKSFGGWSVHGIVKKGDWISVCTVASGDRITVTINDREVATITGVQLRPLLGGSGVNTGSVAFGGPENWQSLYRNLVVKNPEGKVLYENNMQLPDKDKILADFQVGTNEVACMVDGAKRDRSTFGGDLFVSGRGAAYAGLDMEAVAGSIELLSSHQDADGYLGNLCPIQAPVHEGDEPPPTYAFYSVTYAFLLIVAVRDYWLHSGDGELVRRFLPRAEKMLRFAEEHTNASGLVEVHPGMSMHWYPLGGPVFGASGTTNLAYYDALNAVATMTFDPERRTQLSARAETLKQNLLTHLWNPDTDSIKMGMALPGDGISQDTNGYALALDIVPEPERTSSHLRCATSSKPTAFKGLGHWDKSGVVSPYATGFAAEALFARGSGRDAVDLVRAVWGPMADASGPNYSGGHWEAMTADGRPHGHDTSLMHAWSSWPVFLLPQYVVGVKPLEPGWKRLRIAPVLCWVEFAAYGNETPAGRVEVEVKVDEAGGEVLITVTLPADTVAEVAAPSGCVVKGDEVLEGPLERIVVRFLRQETA